MKRIPALIVAIAAVFVLAGHAKAAPMHYTFDGTVSSISTDSAGIIALAELTVGSAVTYTLLVDFAADGTVTQSDGTVVTKTDSTYNDYFFTDYVSGDALPSDNLPNVEYNFGWDDSTESEGYLFVDNILQIYSWSLGGIIVSDWTAGAAVTGYNQVWDSSGADSVLYADLTLTSVTAVPEPSTLLLLGSGLVGLGAFRKRFGRIH